MTTVILQKYCYSFKSLIISFRKFKIPIICQNIKMKTFTQTKNPITGTIEWDIQHEDYDYHQEIARSAFADMLHDTERNKKYQRALQLAIEKMHNAGRKANVLDIGTGTGLLSIMAARCGADSIVACEAFKPMADCCLNILQQNGVADKIKVIPKRSTELTVGVDGDLKEKANILVTEVFDTELIGEGALSTFIHANKYLLEEDSIVVPDSAVVYAQVVQCDTLYNWNALRDFVDEDHGVALVTPQKMKSCPGTAAVHDIQLSQLPRSEFCELSERIPVFHYNWTNKPALKLNQTQVCEFTALDNGKAQIVFVWWELNMDTEGRIVLSCAPWWCHPDADISTERPQDYIPWRDHWMQGVYYLPQQKQICKGSKSSLTCCQDEYSLWFYLASDETLSDNLKRPVCECGVHMTLSRTHIAYLNDKKRNKIFLEHMVSELNKKAVVLDLNGNGFLGLYAAKFGVKTVYILENMKVNIGVLKEYIKENSLINVKVISKVNDEVLSEVTTVVCDPNFSSAILPWENLKVAHLLYSFRDKLRGDVTIVPGDCEVWAMPVQFQDLQKIRVPLGCCEGINMRIFDNLVERSRTISDATVEAQPLWEYPARCSGLPRRLMHLDFHHLQATYAVDGSYNLLDDPKADDIPVNGFAIWMVWRVGQRLISGGPTEVPKLGEIVTWDRHTRQGVKIFKKPLTLNCEEEWWYQIACDIEEGSFNIGLEVGDEK